MLSNTCCMNWEGHPCGSHPSQPTAQVLEVVKITYALRERSGKHSLACGFPQEPHTGEQRGTRTGQSLSQTEHFLGCFLLATTGTDHFPRKLLRLCWFFFHRFHCVVRVKAVAFGSYFPSALLLFPGSKDLFSIRWNAKALSLFGRTQS